MEKTEMKSYQIVRSRLLCNAKSYDKRSESLETKNGYKFSAAT